jgi:hypothetical protein
MTWTATEGSPHLPRVGHRPHVAGSPGPDTPASTPTRSTLALFGNTGTPDNDAALASTGYNTGQWVTGNEVTGSSEWVAGGRALASKTFTSPAADTVMFDAADLTGSATITITNAYGDAGV